MDEYLLYFWEFISKLMCFFASPEDDDNNPLEESGRVVESFILSFWDCGEAASHLEQLRFVFCFSFQKQVV